MFIEYPALNCSNIKFMFRMQGSENNYIESIHAKQCPDSVEFSFLSFLLPLILQFEIWIFFSFNIDSIFSHSQDFLEVFKWKENLNRQENNSLSINMKHIYSQWSNSFNLVKMPFTFIYLLWNEMIKGFPIRFYFTNEGNSYLLHYSLWETIKVELW